ncbi:DNA repair protein complementing XP-A cells homolog [Saccoglossus kowalevskii]|uniref:DNA repair protein complementing XP-A cells homolog n=1 Tax=Saccoglossus kowalevskii TaxID=10224 RepID=A0ABM0M5C7_SACKO|nr:PREDICTED: DNA repair protein complementing XP-A cells homolog [Saccoglossus kowalevskii]
MAASVTENVDHIDDTDDTPSKSKLSDAQRAKIERNRQRALLLRQARLASQPYSKGKPMRRDGKAEVSSVTRSSGQVLDTGGGFLLEEDQEDEDNKINIVHEPAPIIDVNRPRCEDCGKQFSDSFLSTHYNVEICDMCRDDADKHSLITKTDAKQQYLLKDSDLDKREPILKFLVRKNPHSAGWGEMKLYLKSQVLSRALEIWKSEENIQEEKKKRVENKEKLKQKKFDKKMKGEL